MGDFLVMKYSICLLLNFLFALATTSAHSQSATISPIDNSFETTKIQVSGFVENSKVSDYIIDLDEKFFSRPLKPRAGKKTAFALVFYIGPNLISSNKFIPPDDFYIPPQQLEVMENKTFPNEGCRIERLIFPSSGDFVVLAVDATKEPNIEHVHECILIAALAAVGEEMHNVPVTSNGQLMEQLREIVSEM